MNLLKYIFAVTFWCVSLFCNFAFAELSADFSISRGVAGTDVVIEFIHIAQSDGNPIIDYKWFMGDNSEYMGMSNVFHSFAKPGIYDVTLVVKDMYGEEATATKAVRIEKNNFPSADFFFKGKRFVVGQEIGFFSQAKDADKNIEELKWMIDTDPVTVEFGTSLVTRFQNPGKYRVSHIVTDNLGAQSRVEKDIEVFNENQKPTLTVEFPKEAIAEEKNHFKVDMNDQDGKIVRTFWKINGFPEVPFSSNHFEVLFPAEGYYHLSVGAIDDVGGETIVRQKIFARDIKKVPVVKIEIPEKATTGDIVPISGVFKEHADSFSKVKWDFGDGKTQVSEKPFVEHSYMAEGTYKIKALFRFKNGIATEIEGQIEIIPKEKRATPTQVVINDRNYIELIPTQQFLLSFYVYENANRIFSYGTPVWNISNGNVQKNSQTSSSAWIEGVSSGETTISVTVDGVTSQPVTVKVLNFSQGAVTQVGKFIGNNAQEFCLFLNKPADPGDPNYQTYTLTDEFSEFSASITTGESSSDYLGYCRSVSIPFSSSQIEFKAKNDVNSSVYTAYKTFDIFYGRKGFLYFQDNSKLLIDYKDSRLVNWDADFSITYWTLRNSSGYQVVPTITGKLNLLPLQNEGSMSVRGVASSNYKHLHNTKGGEFTNRWTHVGLVYTSSSRNLKLYSDGEAIASITVPADLLNQSGSITIGPPTNTLATLDELRFWNKALSNSEVASELFSPADIYSPNILATFDFDSLDGFQESSNGSGWSYHVIRQGNSTMPQARSVPKTLFDTTVSSTQHVFLESEIPYGEFGNRKASISVDPGDFSASQRLILQVSTCRAGCTDEGSRDFLESKRLSPYFYVSALKNLEYPLILKVPFDVRSVTPEEASKVKAVHVGFNGQPSVIGPIDINTFEGYISFEVGYGGTYWVGIPSNYESSMPVFTNTDLLPAFNSYGQARTWIVTIPSSQTSYTLSTIDSVSIHAASCYPSGQYFGIGEAAFPMTFTDLNASGRHICNILYLIPEGWFGWSYSSYDTIVINKESP